MRSYIAAGLLAAWALLASIGLSGGVVALVLSAVLAFLVARSVETSIHHVLKDHDDRPR